MASCATESSACGTKSEQSCSTEGNSSACGTKSEQSNSSCPGRPGTHLDKAAVGGAPGNPFGPSVVVLESGQDLSAAINAHNDFSEFDEGGAAILLKSGTYSGGGDHGVGYFNHVMGLGGQPHDVVINGGIPVKDEGDHDTRTFFRSIENVSTNGTQTWPVSQGCSVRTCHIHGDLNYWRGKYASGGFTSNTVVDGGSGFGGNQQWFARNSKASAWRAGGMSGVFCGALGDINAFNFRSVTPTTPLVAEKPTLTFDGEFKVVIPALKSDSSGHEWPLAEHGETVPMGEFFIAMPSNTADDINGALQSRKRGVVFTPGTYHFDKTIHVPNDGQVILGIGFPRLSMRDNATNLCIIQTTANNLIIAGVMLQSAAPGTSIPDYAPFLEVGTKVNVNSGIRLHDVFMRTLSSASKVQPAAAVINASDTIIDNMWIWAQDRHVQVGQGNYGLIVSGDRIRAYGLAVEHYQQEQTQWRGEDGEVFFYQCEQAYVNDQELKPSFVLAPNIKSFKGHGMGIYAVVGSSTAHHGMEMPGGPNVQLFNSYRWNLVPDKISNVIKYGDKLYSGERRANGVYEVPTLP